MVKNERWLSGPDFLWSLEQNDWPKEPRISSAVDELELKRATHYTVAAEVVDGTTQASGGLDTLINHYSSWYRLKRAVAWWLRFKEFLLKRGVETKAGNPNIELSLEELKVAERKLVMHAQRQTFSEELSVLRKLTSSKDITKSVKSSMVTKSGYLGPITKLCPFVDEEGVIRVGGRLQHAPIKHDERHQVILPEKHRLTDLIVTEIHQSLGHAGKEHVLASTRELYWIVNGKAAMRRILGSCFACKRQNARCLEQQMASLPADRVTPDEPPFTNVGIDLFGQIMVKQRRSQVKRYGCIFTCLTSRAVHIEIVDSLDTDSFLNGLRRFIGRRGNPKIIRSDNGTNFKCGERELREAIAKWNEKKIAEYLQQRNVEWIFNPPAASHMGGVWERMIQSVKKTLRGLMKDQVVSDETLRTLIVEVEGILNGRPLTSVSDLPNDLDVLTPNHLLLLRSNPNVPPGVFEKSDSYCKRRWRQVQYMADLFWKRWLKEYLPLLQERRKWNKIRRNLQAGDLVMVAEENVHRSQWPLARVVEVHTGKDNRVRSAKVKMRSTMLVRPITKLCLLEQSSDDEE
jgi:hypothetical protein